MRFHDIGIVIALCLGIMPFTKADAAEVFKSSVHSQGVTENNAADLWRSHLQALRRQVVQCAKAGKGTTWNCFKHRSLRLFNGIMTSKEIPLWNGVSFVLRANESEVTRRNDRASAAEDGYERKDYQYLTWFDRLTMSFVRTLKTHQLRINLKELTDAYIRSEDHHRSADTAKIDENTSAMRPSADTDNKTDSIGTARMRRHRYNMMITMMFGATALGAILVPMGFQLLSIVSGKALLMAKMALLLASINGIKRVANSGVHYGLYHVPGDHYGGAYYDRGDVHHPRTVPGLAIAQPLDVGVRK